MLSQRLFRFAARFDFGLAFGLTVDFVFGFVVLAFAADFLINLGLGLGLGLGLILGLGLGLVLVFDLRLVLVLTGLSPKIAFQFSR